MQMDEIHVKSDISYKGGRLFASNLEPDNPTKTVFTSLYYIRDGFVSFIYLNVFL